TIELTTSEAHGGTGWETLTFTFPTATGEWGELALRTNVDASGTLIDPAVEVLEAHFDDLTAAQGSEIPAPASGPTDSPTAPTANAADVVAVFSDAYTNIATNYNPSWNQSGSVSTSYDPGDGNNVMLYSNFNYQGTDLTSTDLTAMEKLHIDIWVADASVRTIKVTPIGGSETLVTVPVTSGAWNSVDIPLSSFTAVDFSDVGQLKFDGQFAADGTTADTTVRSDVYLDNIYFYKEATAGVNENNIIDVSIYPNPSSSNWNFKTGNTVITSVEVFNLLGKRVVLQNNNSTNVAISTQGLTSGIYIARITTEQGTKSVKLIKK
ncbi:MAG: T9SS type A sorting domain-containing protein, partial [Flavobacterium sp.]|nr:T9SS type A sorting domain-containing protein [Flavobacterium sp.]